ncbi:hypothetical protein [Synechococcus sp. CCY 9618]|uniref:hypothetical protein n=1 Tax=Synechococcus sp. CCY 9618 TaxID=2815602 RepID=UPI001C21FEB9|nr:hypothetical protein [Synechococcus sp. CCY 9618]
MPLPPPASNQVFNNADSFAQAFDAAWQTHSRQEPSHGLTASAKLDAILTRVADHPFAQSDPATARQVGAFRIRLLDL